jgi:transcription elongation factor Elf1
MVSTLVTPRPSVIAASPVEPELVGLATCPSCHTEDQSLTKLAVSTGAYWQCGQCGSRWDARRLATVAAYAVWVSERAASERRTRRAIQERTL